MLEQIRRLRSHLMRLQEEKHTFLTVQEILPIIETSKIFLPEFNLGIIFEIIYFDSAHPNKHKDIIRFHSEEKFERFVLTFEE